MAPGISSYLANKIMDHTFRGVAFTAPTTVYAKMHTGNPGASGTSAASSQTLRLATTFGAASAGAISMSNAPEFTLTGTEEISHISFWDAATGGNFLWSAAATAPKVGSVDDIIRVATGALSIGPVAS